MPLLLTAGAKPEHIKILFILYDAGETHALTPVMEAMPPTDYKVLVMGTAREQIQQAAVPAQCIRDLHHDFGTQAVVDKGAWPRETQLSTEDLNQVSKHLTADVIVTGVVSEAQYQLAELYKKSGSKLIGYYDNPHVGLDHFPCSKLLRKFEAFMDTMMVPSTAIAKSFSRPCHVVGQPSLKAWREKVQRINTKKIRQDLGLSQAPLLVFCGGYGENYPQAFELFVQGLNGLKGWQVIIQLHPKVEGSLERKLLKKYGHSHIPVLQKEPGTLPLAATADVVAVYHSSVGLQALFAGKKVLHIDLPESQFHNFATDANIAPKVCDANQMAKVLQKLHASDPINVRILHDCSGIPSDAVQRILDVISQT